jgi:hypothetical protein
VDKIGLKECVRFRHIPAEFIPVAQALLSCAKVQGFEPVITGASYENYPKGGYHDLGYGWDVRTRNVPSPLDFACCLCNQLGIVDPLYYIRYGDKDHTDHIHIAYRYLKKPKA